MRLENGALSIPSATLARRLGAEFEPGPARQAHLGPQPQGVGPVELLDSPPVQGLAHVQPAGITSTPPQPSIEPRKPAAKGLAKWFPGDVYIDLVPRGVLAVKYETKKVPGRWRSNGNGP